MLFFPHKMVPGGQCINADIGDHLTAEGAPDKGVLLIYGPRDVGEGEGEGLGVEK